MGYYVEGSINVYTGLASEDKPTKANGINPLNGSRWREVDTGKEYHYAIETDRWYETGNNLPSIGNNLPTVDIRSLDLLEQILTTLKKIEYHLYLGTDTELKDQDVGG